MAPVELVLAGAGGRGMYAYGPYALAHPDDVRFVAVAEPDAARRAAFAELHGIAAEHCYADWRELLSRPQLGAGAVITTQDHEHTGPALAALVAGYDVLLEKPIAPTLAECVGLVRAAERHGRVLQICHVLRYTGFFTALHAILQQGRLGDLVTVEHRENVAAYHMAHSYVRGNWRRAADSNPMNLAKSCTSARSTRRPARRRAAPTAVRPRRSARSRRRRSISTGCRCPGSPTAIPRRSRRFPSRRHSSRSPR